MTVTLSYDNANARVRVTATGLAAATYATVERSIDQVTWTTCRNGLNVPVTAGALTTTFDDYEFADGRINYYRVRGVSSAAMTFVSAGTAATAAAGPITPGMPASVIAGDLVLIFASTRNAGTGTVNTPASWTMLAANLNTAILGRIYDGVWTIPSVSFTNGAGLEDTIAQTAAFRNASLTPEVISKSANASQQNISYGGFTARPDAVLAIVAGWKQDDWTSVATLAGFTEIQEAVSVAGNDAGQVWDYQIQSVPATIPAGSLVVTGGAAAIGSYITLGIPHAAFLNEQTANITPALTATWLKSINRPFLNQTVTVVDPGDAGRAGRGGLGDVVGRTYPIATTDVRSGQSFPLVLLTSTANDAKNMDFILASGDVLFLHVPAAKDWAGGYLLIGSASAHRRSPNRLERNWQLECTQVAPPGPDIVYAIGTWTSVLAGYPTWNDVLNAFPTWGDLLALVGSPSEVIVG